MDTYITKPNESLQRLAAIMWGDWKLWKLIYDKNPQLGNDPFDIPVGRIIEIPEPLYEDRNHVIASGDSYQSLALLYYGTEHYDFLIRVRNNGIVLYENIDLEIVIPKLISWRRLQFAYNGFRK